MNSNKRLFLDFKENETITDAYGELQTILDFNFSYFFEEDEEQKRIDFTISFNVPGEKGKNWDSAIYATLNEVELWDNVPNDQWLRDEVVEFIESKATYCNF